MQRHDSVQEAAVYTRGLRRQQLCTGPGVDFHDCIGQEVVYLLLF